MGSSGVGGHWDVKGIGVMHAVAAAQLASSGQRPTREVIVVMVGDEEAGGDEGARWLLEEHADLVGFGDGRPAPEVIGEGAYGVTGLLGRPVVPIAMGEKTAVWFDVVAKGDSGVRRPAAPAAGIGEPCCDPRGHRRVRHATRAPRHA